ncbi:MAG TPA: xanthine dehydrogenase family protein molybdopterin-binding subunit [Steroidobacter sp.]|nr:xanthine dehydrogenase family protein molybdopterin-binding subunit [Steroidobacter sp.]
MNKWTRRAFIGVGGVIGGGLAIGVGGVIFAPNRFGLAPHGETHDGVVQLTTWLRITPDGVATVIAPHCEMGQGAQTALAMMLAEELEADWRLVRVEEAPAEDAYANGHLVRSFRPIAAALPRFMDRSIEYASFRLMQWMDMQITGGSTSVRATGQFGMRVAGAAAKAMLLEAAAKRWNVSESQCTAKLSRVLHAGSDRSLSYGELAADAARLDPPVHPAMKKRAEYSIVGASIPRLDIPDKVTGSTRYAIDVSLPDMLYAAVRAAPVFGSKLESVDPAPAEQTPGVVRVVRLENAVAVIADSYWRALKGVRALTPSFTQEQRVTSDSATLFALIGAALEGPGAKSVISRGDAAKALSRAAKLVEAEYRVPFLAHATMEPMSATARCAEGRCEVWTGVQDPLAARKVAAQAAGVSEDQVLLHNHPLGGGFGRRLPGAHDYVDQAVRIAREAAPAPVKLIWSREEDIQHDFYRPAVLARFKGAVDSAGSALVWIARFNGGAADGVDADAVRTPYAIAHQDIAVVEHDTHVRTGFWRSVAHSQHGFFTECFIDELAHAAGAEPYEFRRELLADAPRHRAVLERAAWMAGWGAPPPPGRGRGIALVESFGTIVAQTAEVEVVDGRIKVHRVCVAADCGEVVHPDGAAAQIEGGVLFGLSAALYNEITIRDGRVVQSNFHDYPMALLADAPSIAVEFIESDAPMGGLGEPGVPPIAPAVANAVFAATGKRLRSLPLRL